MATDPYQLLGVAKSASAAEIKSAYRKLAKKLHPDVNPGKKDIEQKFKEVTAAYDLLSDAGKRARYDRGEVDAQGQERGFSGGYGGGGDYSGFGGFRGGRGQSAPEGNPFSGFGGGMEDIFAEFMGGMGGGASARGRNKAREANLRGSDLTYTTSVPFTLAATGGKTRVMLANDKKLDITVPPGIEEGHKLRLKGQGLAGIGGGAGDAIVEIHIEPHPHFTRKGKNIYLDIPVSLPEAVLGASVTVPTLDGQVDVKIPAGAQSGTSLRLKGKGAGGDTAGDMFVKLRIMLPEPMPQDLADFMEKWARKNSYNPRKKAGL